MNFHDLRALAERVPCPARPYGCGAAVGDPCRNLGTGQPLTHRPAHEARLWNAEALVDAEEWS